ncbi:wax ester/triacylglycerol synthase domain-containing protein [Nocardia callitridis]|uniref:Diacylglycerol O-acyltransferase n=1 Tax=Nocardia callitridis TaxID=648753 RepID=A0ABP9JWS9_9NOCA
MHNAQLVGNDAAWHYFARAGRATDWPMWWVFDNAAESAEPMPPADIAEYFGARTDLLEPLRRRIVEVPYGLGHPFWVVDNSPIDQHVTTHSEALDWAKCQQRLGEILARPLDARVSAWEMHVFPDVSGIPTCTGTGTVVLIFVSHALIAGPSMTSLSEALFADRPLWIEGLGPATPRPPLLRTALRGVLRWPWQIREFNARVAAENVRIVREADDSGPHTPPRTRTVVNQRVGAERVVRSVPVDLASLRGSGATVTAVGLTAVSFALGRYLAQRGSPVPEDLAAFITIAVPGATVLGVNRIGSDVVDLSATTTDLAERVRAVDAELRVRKTSASSARELNRLANAELLPSRIFRARYGTYPPHDDTAPALAHTTLTSIKCDPNTPWSLSGRPFRFAGMLPPVYPDICLAQSFVGTPETCTFSAASDPALLPDLDTYCALLTDAVREITAALPAA